MIQTYIGSNTTGQKNIITWTLKNIYSRNSSLMSNYNNGVQVPPIYASIPIKQLVQALLAEKICLKLFINKSTVKSESIKCGTGA
jgi:hypothetical protein